MLNNAPGPWPKCPFCGAFDYEHSGRCHVCAARVTPFDRFRAWRILRRRIGRGPSRRPT